MPLKARPASDFKLSRKERDLLADPDWMTEDEADLIISLRRQAEGGYIPIEEVLAQHGRSLEDQAKPWRRFAFVRTMKRIPVLGTERDRKPIITGPRRSEHFSGAASSSSFCPDIPDTSSALPPASPLPESGTWPQIPL
jgi:hypothetical protein